MALSAAATRVARRAPLAKSMNKAVSARPVLARAEPTPERSSAAPAESKVYFGGKEYTEEQWSAAVASGEIARAMPTAAPSASSGAAVSIGDAMAFAGPAPEIINGRLAMLGLVAALGAEFASDESVVAQIAQEPTGIAAVFALIAAASFPPLLAGKQGKESLGPFTPAAEMLNGRAAMIGMASLLVLEAFKHGPLF